MKAKFIMTYEVEVDIGTLPAEAVAWSWMEANQQNVSYEKNHTPWEDGDPKLVSIEPKED